MARLAEPYPELGEAISSAIRFVSFATYRATPTELVAIGVTKISEINAIWALAAIAALILLVPSIAFMLVIERFLNTQMLAKIG